MECKNLSDDNCYSITWAIQNYSCCWQKRKKPVISPMFSIKASKETNWRLILYPRGMVDGNYIAFFLYREKDCNPTGNLEVEYDLEILRPDGSILKTTESKQKFEQDTQFGFSKFLTRKALSEEMMHLPRDVITVRCRIKRFSEQKFEIRQIFARTIIKVERISFMWRIEQFHQMTLDETKSFVIKSALDSCIIRIDLSLTDKDGPEENICLNMRSFENGMKFSLMKTFILDYMKCKINSGEFECFFGSGKGLTHLLKITNNMIKENKDLYLHEGVLCLGFEIAISTGILYEGLEYVDFEYTAQQTVNEITVDWRIENDEESEPDENNSELKVDLMLLYKDKSLSDMKLKTKNNNFFVHTSILGARSPVFRAMFSSDMVNRCVDMSNFQVETIRRFLLYLYSDKLEDLKWEDAVELYKISDKYAVFSLARKCAVFLRNNLNLDNVCEALMISDMHQDKDLKELAQNLILKNSNMIFKSEEWKALAEMNSKLSIETMLRFWDED